MIKYDKYTKPHFGNKHQEAKSNIFFFQKTNKNIWADEFITFTHELLCKLYTNFLNELMMNIQSAIISRHNHHHHF